jgi:hypothetical protein
MLANNLINTQYSASDKPGELWTELGEIQLTGELPI